MPSKPPDEVALRNIDEAIGLSKPKRSMQISRAPHIISEQPDVSAYIFKLASNILPNIYENAKTNAFWALNAL